MCGHGSSTTNSRRVRHNDTTKRVNDHVKQNSYPFNPRVELVENNAGLSERVSELQGSSRLGLTEPDDKAKALNRGRTGEVLNPNVKPFLSAASYTVVSLLVTKGGLPKLFIGMSRGKLEVVGYLGLYPALA